MYDNMRFSDILLVIEKNDKYTRRVFAVGFFDFFTSGKTKKRKRKGPPFSETIHIKDLYVTVTSSRSLFPNKRARDRGYRGYSLYSKKRSDIVVQGVKNRNMRIEWDHEIPGHELDHILHKIRPDLFEDPDLYHDDKHSFKGD
jgi:hypothetical protein